MRVQNRGYRQLKKDILLFVLIDLFSIKGQRLLESLNQKKIKELRLQEIFV